MIQAYLLYFNTNIMKIQAEVIHLNNENSDILSAELKKHLNASGYDFIDYSKDIAIIIDDHGFEKELNPVFEVVSDYGDVNQLAGKLLFVRNIENKFSVDIGSIKYEDIFSLRINLSIKLIGITKKEQG